MENKGNNEKQKTWKKVLGILLLIFMTPIGIVFMWCTKIFGKKARIVISCICAPIAIIYLLVLIAGMSEPSNSSNTNKDTSIETKNESSKDNQKQENKKEEQDTNIEKNETKSKSEDKSSQNAEEVSFNDLKRNPDKYTGKRIIVKGYINQVLEGDDSSPSNLKIYDDATGSELILLYDRKQGQERYLEGDYISSVAVFEGIQGLEMLDGSNQAFPIATVETIKANTQ